MFFCVMIERNLVYLRIEYIFEYFELFVYFVKFICDGIGQGWLEVDIFIVVKIEVVYLVDVVVVVLVLVVYGDD